MMELANTNSRWNHFFNQVRWLIRGAASALFCLCFSLHAQQTPPSASTNDDIPTYTYEITNTFPHERSAFTEGLFYLNGDLYESTGLNGQSTLRRVELTTGKVLQKIDVPAEYFGEGLA